MQANFPTPEERLALLLGLLIQRLREKEAKGGHTLMVGDFSFGHIDLERRLVYNVEDYDRKNLISACDFINKACPGAVVIERDPRQIWDEEVMIGQHDLTQCLPLERMESLRTGAVARALDPAIPPPVMPRGETALERATFLFWIFVTSLERAEDNGGFDLECHNFTKLWLNPNHYSVTAEQIELFVAACRFIRLRYPDAFRIDKHPLAQNKSENEIVGRHAFWWSVPRGQEKALIREAMRHAWDEAEKRAKGTPTREGNDPRQQLFPGM